MTPLTPPPAPPSLPPAATASPSYPQIQFHHGKPATSLPGFLYRALSLFFIFSSSKSTITTYTHSHLLKLSFPLNRRRRFLNVANSNMSFPPNPTTTHKFPYFPTPQSLSDWLKPRLPSDSFAAWGIKPGTKNIHNLWLELSEGETLLADSIPPVRTVEVVIVRVIGNKGKLLLVESHQELSNGDVRNRCRPLSEKMKPGESVEAAVYRAVKEELGSIINSKLGPFENFDCGGDSNIVRMIPGSYTKKLEERYSESYPGLPACYVLHTVDAVVEGLPESEFCTEEADEYDNLNGKKVADGAVFCRKHYWKWVDTQSL